MADGYLHEATSDDDYEGYDEWLDSLENQPYKVRCKTCKTSDQDTRKNLEIKGWLLVASGEWCPSH